MFSKFETHSGYRPISPALNILHGFTILQVFTPCLINLDRERGGGGDLFMSEGRINLALIKYAVLI